MLRSEYVIRTNTHLVFDIIKDRSDFSKIMKAEHATHEKHSDDLDVNEDFFNELKAEEQFSRSKKK